MDAPQWVRDRQYEHMIALWKADHADAEPDDDTCKQIRQHAHDIADDIHRAQFYETQQG